MVSDGSSRSHQTHKDSSSGTMNINTKFNGNLGLRYFDLDYRWIKLMGQNCHRGGDKQKEPDYGNSTLYTLDCLEKKKTFSDCRSNGSLKRISQHTSLTALLWNKNHFHFQFLWKLNIVVRKKHLFTSVCRLCSAHSNSEYVFLFLWRHLVIISKDTSETLFRVLWLLKQFSRDFLFSRGIGNLQSSRQCGRSLIWSTRAWSCSNRWWISLRYSSPVL